MDRIRDAFTSIVDGDSLASLANDLDVDSSKLKRLPQLEQDLSSVQHSKYMFN